MMKTMVLMTMDMVLLLPPDNSEEAPADPCAVVQALSKKVDKSKQLFFCHKARRSII